jgi:HPt (histidine-containing phosphotransfer) domain-containing protein
VPIVAFTARAMPDERQRCLAAGMGGYLIKPFTPEELYAAVEGAQAPRSLPDALASARAELMRRYPEDHESVDDILRVFQEEEPGLLDRVRSASQAGDMEALALHSHAFKSAAATAGFVAMQELCGKLEGAARSGDQDASVKLFEMLLREAQ